MRKILFNIIKLIYYILDYIIINVVGVFTFIYHLISNIFERKCKYNIEDVIGLEYSCIGMDIYHFFVYVNGTDIKENMDYCTYHKLNNKEYKKFKSILKKTGLLTQKKYRLYNPFISVLEYYRRLYYIDYNVACLTINIYFKDGKLKTLENFPNSYEIEKFLLDICPEEDEEKISYKKINNNYTDDAFDW